jgi:hypothetical protein
MIAGASPSAVKKLVNDKAYRFLPGMNLSASSAQYGRCQMANEAVQRQAEPHAARKAPNTALAVPVMATDDRRM